MNGFMFEICLVLEAKTLNCLKDSTGEGWGLERRHVKPEQGGS